MPRDSGDRGWYNLVDPTLQDVLGRLERVSGQLEELRDGVRQAVAIAELDPDMALTRARKVLEFIVRDVFQRHTGEEAGTRPLENLLQRLVKDGYFPKRLSAYANAVRELGNVGTHSYGEGITKTDVAQSLAQLTVILEWYFEHERPAGKLGVVPPPRASAPLSAGVISSAGAKAEPVSKPARDRREPSRTADRMVGRPFHPGGGLRRRLVVAETGYSGPKPFGRRAGKGDSRPGRFGSRAA